MLDDNGGRTSLLAITYLRHETWVVGPKAQRWAYCASEVVLVETRYEVSSLLVQRRWEHLHTTKCSSYQLSIGVDDSVNVLSSPDWQGGSYHLTGGKSGGGHDEFSRHSNWW